MVSVQGSHMPRGLDAERKRLMGEESAPGLITEEPTG